MTVRSVRSRSDIPHDLRPTALALPTRYLVYEKRLAIPYLGVLVLGLNASGNGDGGSGHRSDESACLDRDCRSHEQGTVSRAATIKPRTTGSASPDSEAEANRSDLQGLLPCQVKVGISEFERLTCTGGAAEIGVV
jgi:hypothetical protein